MKHYLLSQRVLFKFKNGEEKEAFTSKIITGEGDVDLSLRELSKLELYVVRDYMQAHDIKDEDVENMDVQLLGFSCLGSLKKEETTDEDHE